MYKFLAVSGLYENQEEAAKREEVLHRLQQVKGEIEIGRLLCAAMLKYCNCLMAEIYVRYLNVLMMMPK